MGFECANNYDGGGCQVQPTMNQDRQHRAEMLGVNKELFDYVQKLFGRDGLQIVRERNRVGRRIQGEITGLQVVPAEALLDLLQQPRWLWAFQSSFPGKQGAVIFSSPACERRGRGLRAAGRHEGEHRPSDASKRWMEGEDGARFMCLRAG